ncbi:MAG: RNA methyltransferase [Paramuribaculum sp.]|nr:RNA methyltransferase [Paramuribaculum sp.]
MELTASLRKFVMSLSSARRRREEGAFIAEGTKCVCDTIDAFSLRYLFATNDWIDKHSALNDRYADRLIPVSKKDFERISSLSTPSEVLAVYDLPDYQFTASVADDELVVALDGVQDPGNVGTIIRAADWFGVRHIILSEDCADAYSPKTVMATMGAISRVKIMRGNLAEILNDCYAPIYGTFLDGESIYETVLSPTGIIVMGNEGNGISENISGIVNNRILIPSYPPDSVTSESLNVGMATSIVLSEFRRRLITDLNG